MSYKSSRQIEDERRLAERAAEWIAVLPDASAEERAEFVRWIQESPAHLQEFLMASAVVRGLGKVDLGIGPLEKAAEPSNVVHLAPALGNTQRNPVRIARMKYWGIAASIALAAAVLAIVRPFWFGGQTYQTGVGEQRTILLSDGSVIQMNVTSRVTVSLTDESRQVQLIQGEALFNVKRDAQRPFRVISGTPVIEVLGTQFNVRRRPTETLVSVVDGLIQVSNRKTNASTIKLGAGEAARIGVNGRIAERTTTDPATVGAWRQQRLDFRAERLTDIAAEFNRHNERPQVQIIGEAVGERRYSGVFNAHDPKALVDFLREDNELEIEDSGAKIAIRARSENTLR